MPISVIVVLLVSAILLIIADIKKIRLRWRIILVCIVGFSPIMDIASRVWFRDTEAMYVFILKKAQEKINANDIDSIRHAFRDFDPDGSLPQRISNARKLCDELVKSKYDIKKRDDSGLETEGEQ